MLIELPVRRGEGVERVVVNADAIELMQASATDETTITLRSGREIVVAEDYKTLAGALNLNRGLNRLAGLGG